MTTSAEVTASERESYRATIAALDAELARQKALNWRMLEKRARDVARIGRLRSRLARVLDLCMRGGFWVRHSLGPGRLLITSGRIACRGVWSRRALPTPTPDKETTR